MKKKRKTTDVLWVNLLCLSAKPSVVLVTKIRNSRAILLQAIMNAIIIAR